MEIQTFSTEEALTQLLTMRPHQKTYLAMYSSWVGGIVRDAPLMVVPIDDHIVHRGDGLFEAIKIESGRVYALRTHLNRLCESMNAVQLTPPFTVDEMEEICMATARVAGSPEAIIRAYVSRGPGGFTPNPYESIGAQFYVVITQRHALKPELLTAGAKMGLSKYPIKPGFFANTKSCNYLPNVLMKKEAIDAGLDYTVSLDEKGFIAEGSTENVACVTTDGDLVIPRFDRTLRGVTASRIIVLAEQLVAAGVLRSVQNRDVTIEEFAKAREIHVYGTTIDVLPVGQFQTRVLKGFDVALKLRELLHKDLQNLDVSKILLETMRR